jgi:AraC-like DNA-binding protein
LDEPFRYCVVADGCIDIFFELQNPAESYVMGFCKRYTEFTLNRQFNYVGVRFLPSMFPQLFGINASGLSNRYELLRLILPETADVIKHHFNEALSSGEVKNRFDDCFLRYPANRHFDYDPRFYRALSLILDKRGLVDLEKDLDTGISERQLRRLFEFYIGTSPKTFSQVVRFQSVLRAKPSSQRMKQDKLFFEAGYYDQAHFIKEFKTFYGITPGQAFER